MTLRIYRQITQPRYDNGTGGGTDNSTDNTTVDPNKYLVTPINKVAEIAFIALVVIVLVIGGMKLLKMSV